MKQEICPVCSTSRVDSAFLCATCGWDYPIVIGGGAQVLEGRLTAARKAWGDRKPSEMFPESVPSLAQSPAKGGVVPVAKRFDPTLAADLKRGAEESRDQYAKRLGSRPWYVGDAEPQMDAYDRGLGVVPLAPIVLPHWVRGLLGRSRIQLAFGVGHEDVFEVSRSARLPLYIDFEFDGIDVRSHRFLIPYLDRELLAFEVPAASDTPGGAVATTQALTTPQTTRQAQQRTNPTTKGDRRPSKFFPWVASILFAGLLAGIWYFVRPLGGDPATAQSLGDGPSIKVGDTYSYEVTTNNSRGKSSSYVTTREVTAVEGDRVTVMRESGATGSTRSLMYDRHWNLVETEPGNSSSGMLYTPPLRYFDFPLTPGKTWTVVSTEYNKKTGRTRKHTLRGEVLGWDRGIGVWNGAAVDALRIRLETLLDDGIGSSTSTDISWYVPLVGRSVYSQITGLAADGTSDSRVLRLVGFEPTGLASRAAPAVAESSSDLSVAESSQHDAPAQNVARELTSTPLFAIPYIGSSVDPSSRAMNPPNYPPEERRRGIQGTTVLVVGIDAGGGVIDVSVEKSSGNRNLDREAVNAARRWHFNPEVKNGQKVAGRARVPVKFVLR